MGKMCGRCSASHTGIIPESYPTHTPRLPFLRLCRGHAQSWARYFRTDPYIQDNQDQKNTSTKGHGPLGVWAGLSSSNSSSHFCPRQTNDDSNKMPADPRRPMVQMALRRQHQQDVVWPQKCSFHKCWAARKTDDEGFLSPLITYWY